MAEVAGSLRRWLAFREPSQVRLGCTGPSEEVARSAVPDVLEIPLDESRRYRETTVLLGESGFAALDRTSRDEPGSSDPGGAWPLAARGFGAATSPTERLVDLVRSWDAAGRPATGAVRIAAYPGSDHPPVPTGGFVERADHTTFAVTT